MGVKGQRSNLDDLLHQLAVVNARLQDARELPDTLYCERREIMELLTRERLGNARRWVWKSHQPSVA